MAGRRPNFILFITDQLKATHLGCYGDPIVRTPNIDRLAAHGTAYERAYVATPVCQPNRISLITGRMPSVHHSRHNGIPLSLDANTFVELLREAGYATGLIGKAHFQNVADAPPGRRERSRPDQDAPPANLDEAVRCDRTSVRYHQEIAALWRTNPRKSITLPFYGFEHVRLCSSHGDLVQGHYSAWLAERCPGADKLRGRANSTEIGEAPQSWRTGLPPELYPTSYIAEESMAFIERQAKQRSPFFLMASFPDPHHPFTPPGRYWDMYDPAKVTLPKSFGMRIEDYLPDDPEIQAAYGMGRADRDAFWPIPVNEAEARRAIALNYGAISMIDDAIGRVLATLGDLGLSEETIVLFTSDHGDYMGERGLLLKMGLHFDSVIRTPLIWMDPSAATRGRRSDRLCSTIDISDTILDRAGLQAYFGMQGRSLLSPQSSRKGVVIEDYGASVFTHPDAPAGITSYVSDGWRMSIYESSDWGELFNVDQDPDEINNLWDHSDCQAVKLRLLHGLGQDTIRLRDRSASPTSRA